MYIQLESFLDSFVVSRRWDTIQLQVFSYEVLWQINVSVFAEHIWMRTSRSKKFMFMFFSR